MLHPAFSSFSQIFIIPLLISLLSSPFFSISSSFYIFFHPRVRPCRFSFSPLSFTCSYSSHFCTLTSHPVIPLFPSLYSFLSYPSFIRSTLCLLILSSFILSRCLPSSLFLYFSFVIILTVHSHPPLLCLAFLFFP